MFARLIEVLPFQKHANFVRNECELSKLEAHTAMDVSQSWLHIHEKNIRLKALQKACSTCRSAYMLF